MDNSQGNRSEQSPALEVKQCVPGFGKAQGRTVEHRGLRGIAFQQPLSVGVGEVLKLHDAPLAEPSFHGVDELVH